MTNAVSLKSVRKDYPGFQLGPIDLEVAQGTSLALIGPNGAGKTTLMDLIGGALAPTAGRIAVLGHDATGADPAWKAGVGYAGEQPFYERWTARANLRFLAGYYPAWSAEAEERLVDHFGLPADKRVKDLSRGNRVKLQLVAALARRPRLLLLDEPTAGLDPLVRDEVLSTLWDLLEQEGMTLVYSTHILSDVDRLADELAFIRDGRLTLRAGRDELEARWRRVSFRLPGALTGPVTDDLLDHRAQGALHLAVSRDFERTSDLLRALGATQLEAQRLSLEEVSLYVLRGVPAIGDAGRSGGFRPGTVGAAAQGGEHAPRR